MIFFVLTAYHVIKGVSDNDLLICLGIENQKYPFKKEKIWYNEKLDIAYIQLNRGEAKFGRGLNIEPFKIGEANESRELNFKVRYAINGFPGELSKFIEREYVIQAESYLITTFFIPPNKWPYIDTDDLNSENIFILGYGKEALNNYGDKQETKDVHGMSGAGVWLFNPETEDSEYPVYELYGIQTGWYKNDNLLRGSFLHTLILQIKEDYK